MEAPKITFDLSKPYSFSFKGGPSDGVVLRTDSEIATEQQEAMAAVLLTGGAPVGKGFRGKAPGTSLEQFSRNIISTPEGPKLVGSPPQAHEYRVTERNEEGDRIMVQFEYKGIAT